MDQKLKICVVDDEQKSRATLKEMLSLYKNVEVKGEAESVSQAFELIREVRPDVVFLDIELGDGTGFDLLEMFGPVFFKQSSPPHSTSMLSGLLSSRHSIT